MMATKRVNISTKQMVQRYCGECANGTWSDNPLNKDFDGKPFLKVCKYSEYAKNIKNERVCLRGTHACEHFREEVKKI